MLKFSSPENSFLKVFSYAFVALVFFFCLPALSEEEEFYDDEEGEEEQIAAPAVSKKNSEETIYIRVKDEEKDEEKEAAPSSASVQNSVSEQKPIQVIAEPIRVSRPEKLRIAREQAEKTTEDKIKEKLESIRLREEQKRLNQILHPLGGPGAVSSSSSGDEPQGGEQADVYLRPSGENFNVGGKGYIFGGAGRLMYYGSGGQPMPVSSSMVYSLGIGMLEGSRLGFSASVSRSKHRLNHETRLYKNLFTHYSGAVSLKYFLFSRRRIKPFIGGLISYSYRRYTGEQRTWDWYDRTSQSVNFGLSGGMDVFLGSNFAVSAEGRVFFTEYAFEDDRWTTNSSYFTYYETQVTPEESTWATFNVYVKVLF